MTRVIDMADPARGDDPGEFQGYRHGAGVSFIVVDAPPGGGPKLHRHPYEEVFVVQEGTATFTAGEEVIEASGGQVVVVPAGVPHKFVNSGTGRLRQVDITRQRAVRHRVARRLTPSYSSRQGSSGQHRGSSIQGRPPLARRDYMLEKEEPRDVMEEMPR